RSAGADKRHYFATFHFQINVAQDVAGFAILAIGKAHTLKADAAAKWRKVNRAGPLLHFVFSVHEVEDRSRSSQRLLEVVIEDGKLAYRVVKLEYRHNER